MSRLIFNMAAKCDKAGRSENQDNYWVCPDLTHWDAQIGKSVGNDEDVELSTKGALLVVADGMGGMNAGEKASELVIAGVKKRFSNIPESILTNEEEIKKFIKDTITEADQSVKDYAKANRSAEGLGSTIVLLWILNERAYCGWCGDSRIYRYNPNNELVRLSHDHSYVQGLVDEGKISEEDAFDHPDGNIITRSLGDNGDVANPEIMVYDVCERDVFLLCSDGLCGLLPDKDIEDIISRNCSSTKDALAALWEAGTKAGWSDNATIDLLYVISGGKRPKGVAVGYPTKKQVKTTDSNKKPNNSVVSSESAAVKFLRPPYLYYILVVAIGILCLALYHTCSSHSNSEQENFNFTIGTGDTISSQTNENAGHTGNANTGDNEINGGSQNQGSLNNGNTGANQHNGNSNGRNNNGSNGHNNANPNTGSSNGTNGGNNSNTGTNNGGNNASQIISSINGQQGGNSNPPREEQTRPDPQYMKQLNDVRKDVKSVRSAWRNVLRFGDVTKSEYNRLKNFATNVSHLADKNNPSYKCLDAKTQNEINSWLPLVNEINNNLGRLRVVEDENVYGGTSM